MGALIETLLDIFQRIVNVKVPRTDPRMEHWLGFMSSAEGISIEVSVMWINQKAWKKIQIIPFQERILQLMVNKLQIEREKVKKSELKTYNHTYHWRAIKM